jgi:hypothetical protein
MRAWKLLGVLTVIAAAACGLDATGEFATGGDSGAAEPPDGSTGSGSGSAPHDAAPGLDSTLSADGAPDVAGDASQPPVDTGAPPAEAAVDAIADVTADAPPSSDAAPPPDAPADSVADAPGDGSTPPDAAVDGNAEATPSDAGAPDAPNDGSADALVDAPADAGVDVTGPPGICILSYGCGSQSCGCSQTCDNGSACGACLPGHGTCNFDLHSCDTDLTTVFNCGSCGNRCTCSNAFNAKCTLTGATYQCGC